MIYVIRADNTNLYKIGFTDRDYEKRLNELQTGCPHDLTLVLWLDGTQEEERSLHDKLNGFRFKREWFELDFNSILVMLFSLLLKRRVRFSQINAKSKAYKDRLRNLWTPTFFVNTYYTVDYDNTNVSATTGISDTELWMKFSEVCDVNDNPIVKNKSEFCAWIEREMTLSKRKIDGTNYYNLVRRQNV